MKRILSFILAAIMIASMAAVAFAEESETTEVTLYDSKGELDKGGENFVVTPEKLRGLEGFGGEMVFRANNELTGDSVNYEDLWKFADAKNGDTVYVYYYVESATNADVMIYNKHYTAAANAFPKLDMTAGWHKLELVLDKDCPAFGLHTKLLGSATSGSYDIYFGDVVVRDGTVYHDAIEKTVITSEQLAAGATKTEESTGKNFVGYCYPATRGDFVPKTPLYSVETPDNIKEAMGDKIGDTSLKTESTGLITTLFSGAYTFAPGYKYVIVVNGYVEEKGGSTMYLDFNGDYNIGSATAVYYMATVPDSGVATLAFNVDLTAQTQKAWNLSLRNMFKGYVGDVVIYKIDATRMDKFEGTFTPADLATFGTQGTLTSDGLLFSKAAFENASVLTLSDIFKGISETKNVKVGFEVTEDINLRFYDNGTTFLAPFNHFNFITAPQTFVDDRAAEFDTPLKNFWKIHASGTPKGSVVIKYISIANVGGNPVKETIRPIDVVGYTNKVENGKTADVFTAGADVFTAGNNYVVTFNYKVLAGASAEAAPTLTVGGQTLILDKTAGVYSAIVAIMNDAEKFTVSAGDTTVVIGDITYYVAGEEFAELVDTVQGIPTDIKLEFTLVKTAEAAEAYIRSAAQKKYTDYTVLKVEVLDFALPTDDASVARASAAEGSVVAKIRLEQNETHLVYEENLTFTFYKNPKVTDYNAATGDGLFVLIASAIAIVSLAGVMLAKKKVNSK